MEENQESMTQEMDEALDAAWNESDVQADQPGADFQENQAEASPEPPEQARADGNPEQTPAQEETAKAKPELFTLKNRDETRQVSREELIALGQKGWDYDRVRTERDGLRQYRQEAEPALSLVKAFAEKSGMSVAQYVDYCRKQEIMQRGVNEATAQAQLDLEKQQAALAAQQAQVQAETQARQRAQAEQARRAQARQAEMSTFLSTYPDVKPDSIPKEVWAQVAQGVPLTTAYTMHRNQTLEAELAAERQNRENQRRSPGSLKTEGDGGQDELDAIWYSDD